MTEKEEKNLKRDYLKGLTYKKLTEKYNITRNQLIVFIRKNKLSRSKSEINKGNKNAVGNKGGAPKQNKNAVVTGVYETIFKNLFDENEKVIYEKHQEKMSVKDKIKQEIAIIEIREKRALERIQEKRNSTKEMSVASLSSTKSKYTNNLVPDTSTNTVLEPNLNIIQRLEDGLTKIQETKRRYLEILSKLEDDKPDDDSGEDKDPFIEALNNKAGDVWNEEK